ncbi:MAG: VirB8/TrbF family protein [Acetobacteraceae bacterium]
MSDDADDRLTPPPVFRDQDRAHWKRVESFQRSRARSASARMRMMFFVSAALFVLCCMQAVALAYTVPLIRVIPTFIYARPDGTFETAVTPNGLPPNLSQAAQIAAAWQFIRLYEGYSRAESEYMWNVVSAMAAKPVRDQYQADHSPKNKESPINALGDKAIVHVDFISASPACDGCTNRYNFRFVRTIKVPGDIRPQRTTWVATIQWTLDHANRIDVRERLTYNAPGLIVTDYPGAQREDVPQR